MVYHSYESKMSSFMNILKCNRNKYDFPPILNTYIFQSLNPFDSKIKLFLEKIDMNKICLEYIFFTS